MTGFRMDGYNGYPCGRKASIAAGGGDESMRNPVEKSEWISGQEVRRILMCGVVKAYEIANSGRFETRTMPSSGRLQYLRRDVEAYAADLVRNGEATRAARKAATVAASP